MNLEISKKFVEKEVQIEGYYLYTTLQFIPAHKITYLEFGDTENKNILICAHGLTRNAHDFDRLAYSLSKNFRVISINYPGRDTSSPFTNSNHYNFFTYIKDTEYLLNELRIENPIWLGTSMGGIIGMYLSSKCKALILNDVGPTITSDSLNHIKEYAAEYPTFDSLEDGKNHLKKIYHSMGLTEEQDWDDFTSHSLSSFGNGKYQMNFDRNITDNMVVLKQDINLWHAYNQIPCSILIIHGEKSTILNHYTVRKMRDAKITDLLEVNDVGHAPSLMRDDQINYIKQWVINLPANTKNINARNTGFLTFCLDMAKLYSK